MNEEPNYDPQLANNIKERMKTTREHIEKDTILFVSLTCPTCDKPLFLAVKDSTIDHKGDGGLWLSCCQDTACPMIRHDHNPMKMIEKLKQLQKEAKSGEGPMAKLRKAIKTQQQKES